ncbi:MAG: bifunctional precorrin-2 dehydrogenase/sirohydrochlorin ferrochelatase [Actinomycetota bacterium]|nr:bifunctional precorrin-2 dehydrogenase/sirohydrochlorin ferrochelatase [Actinomycetota bacterium]
MLDTPLYVACLILAGRRALVVGAGSMAEEKIEGLVACGAEVTVVTRDPDLRLEELQAAGNVELRRKVYDASDLEGFFLVVAATNDADLGRRVFDDAEARGMLVNVADMPEFCNFILPALARRGPLTVAISTSGASPALAKRMRDEADTAFDEAYARLAQILDDLRPWARSTLADFAARRDFFAAIVNGEPDPIELLRSGSEDEVLRLIAEAQERVR